MKRIRFLVILALGLSVQLMMGQATFDFRNYSSPFAIDAPVMDWDGNLLTGSNWRFELYGGVTHDSLAPVVKLIDGLNRAIIPLWLPGCFRADLALPGNPDLAVAEVPVGGWAWLQVKAWDVGLGSTYEETVAKGLGGYGQSELFYARGGNPAGSPPDLPAPLIGLQSFSVLEIVPEPAAGVLLLAALLGGWVSRRLRRQR